MKAQAGPNWKWLALAESSVNFGWAGILPEQRGSAAPQEWSRSLTQVRDDGVGGVDKSGVAAATEVQTL